VKHSRLGDSDEMRGELPPKDTDLRTDTLLRQVFEVAPPARPTERGADCVAELPEHHAILTLRR
jgi:hypothetical protein